MNILLNTRLLLWICFFSFVLHNSVFMSINFSACEEAHPITEAGEAPDTLESHFEEEDDASIVEIATQLAIGSRLFSEDAHFTTLSHKPGPLLPPPKSS